jgi:predicted acylesterase/phospholipase RssA
MSKKALVISGGGSKGAFAVGAVNYLVTEKHLDFDIITGTSTGALIAPMVVANNILNLVSTYSTVKTENIITPNPLVDAFVNGDSIYSVQPLINIIRELLDDTKANQIIHSQKQMFLATGCLQTTDLTYFQTGPTGITHDSAELIQIRTPEELRRAMLASADQPVLMPPVEVIKGSQPIRQYVDGGTRAVVPTEIAIVNGATELYVIALSAENKVPINDQFNNILKILLGTIGLFTTQITEDDVKIAGLRNGMNTYFNAVHKKVQSKLNLSDEDTEKFFVENLPHNPIADTPISTLFVIRPDDELPTDGLEFDPPTMSNMMELGRQKAKKIVG